MGYKLGSISATAAKWNDCYLTAPGRLEAPFFHPKSNIHLWPKGKRNRFFGSKSQYVASLSSSLRVFDFGGHTIWQHHVYLCCGDEWVEKLRNVENKCHPCWMKVPGFDVDYDVATLRRMLWCEQALALEKWALVGNGLMAQRPFDSWESRFVKIRKIYTLQHEHDMTVTGRDRHDPRKAMLILVFYLKPKLSVACGRLGCMYFPILYISASTDPQNNGLLFFALLCVEELAVQAHSSCTLPAPWRHAATRRVRSLFEESRE